MTRMAIRVVRFILGPSLLRASKSIAPTLALTRPCCDASTTGKEASSLRWCSIHKPPQLNARTVCLYHTDRRTGPKNGCKLLKTNDRLLTRVWRKRCYSIPCPNVSDYDST